MQHKIHPRNATIQREEQKQNSMEYETCTPCISEAALMLWNVLQGNGVQEDKHIDNV